MCRQGEADGELAAVAGHVLGMHHARRGRGGEAAILLGIAVKQLGVRDGVGYADAVLRPRDGGEVGGEQHGVARVPGLAEEGDDALLAVVHLQPVEPDRLEVGLEQRRLRPVEPVEVLEEPAERAATAARPAGSVS
jgi:hypothetical protein